MATDENAPWGRVDDEGTVYVREADGERAVGQYPDATPEEALAYFTRKFTELEGQVALLEQRVRGGAPAKDVAKAVAHLSESITGANAVGDLASLGGTVGELTEKQLEENKAAVAEALVEREALVAEAEALAAADPAKAQWKQVSAQLDALFERWQDHQKNGPRLPKNESNELWKRFRAARTTIETHRKAFFAELDSVHKEVRARKQSLIERAEKLAPQGADGIPEYRRLLDEWKAAGRAGKKLDDALWAKFKEAGDALYAAKAELMAIEDEEYAGNLTEKLALLEEAEKLLKVTDRTAAKETLLGIQRKWDAIGGDKKKIAEAEEAIAARKVWLGAIGS